MRKSAEFSLGEKLVAGSLIFGLGLVACNRKNEATCFSPRRSSPIYKGDPLAEPGNQETWISGIEVNTTMPPDALGLIVGFAAPEAASWEDSKPVDPDRTSSIGLRIGPGDVEFSTRIEAPEGSAACDTAPASNFSEVQNFDEVIKRGAVKPEWP